jgi:4-hydroxy-tetrahydrodipicolinate reductase
VTVAVTVLGPSGRMGQAIVNAAAGRADVRVAATLHRSDAAPRATTLGPEVIATSLIDRALAAAPVYIDFTTPAATAAVARAARAKKIAAVVGTTGLTTEAEGRARRPGRGRAGGRRPQLLGRRQPADRPVRDGGADLGTTWDAEIVELHHKAKRDAPSGTALGLARAIAAARDQDLAAVGRYARVGDVGARPAGEIGAVAVRGGDVVGEHTAFFFGAGERVELSHRATDRAIFAHGALRAAVWAVGQRPGRYDMLDVLGMR